MKKLTTILLTLVLCLSLVFGLTACDSSDEEDIESEDPVFTTVIYNTLVELTSYNANWKIVQTTDIAWINITTVIVNGNKSKVEFNNGNADFFSNNNGIISAWRGISENEWDYATLNGFTYFSMGAYVAGALPYLFSILPYAYFTSIEYSDRVFTCEAGDIKYTITINNQGFITHIEIIEVLFEEASFEAWEPCGEGTTTLTFTYGNQAITLPSA